MGSVNKSLGEKGSGEEDRRGVLQFDIQPDFLSRIPLSDRGRDSGWRNSASCATFAFEPEARLLPWHLPRHLSDSLRIKANFSARCSSSSMAKQLACGYILAVPRPIYCQRGTWWLVISVGIFGDITISRSTCTPPGQIYYLVCDRSRHIASNYSS